MINYELAGINLGVTKTAKTKYIEYPSLNNLGVTKHKKQHTGNIPKSQSKTISMNSYELAGINLGVTKSLKKSI
jgi:hypothetical protein